MDSMFYVGPSALFSAGSLGFSNLIRTPTRSDSRTRLQQRGEGSRPRREEARSRARRRCLLGGWGSAGRATGCWRVGVPGLIVSAVKRTVHGVWRGLTGSAAEGRNVSRYVTYGNRARSFAEQPTANDGTYCTWVYAHTVRGLPCNLHVLLSRG